MKPVLAALISLLATQFSIAQVQPELLTGGWNTSMTDAVVSQFDFSKATDYSG